jgi:ribonuclease D
MSSPLQFQLITDDSGVRNLAEVLCREPLVACDLEADSLHHYREQVCLLQFSTPSANYLLDPLAVRDLSPLCPFFADPSIRKVFHGADYDVRSLYRDFGIDIVNLFDTMIACQFLGEKEWGLAAALRKRFGVELDKQYQTADWSQRPLPAGMLGYAVLDTAHLIAFYEQVARELTDKGRLAWVEEECQLLTRVRKVERGDEPLFVRCKGAGRLSPRCLAVLEALLEAREREAERRDRPPFKVIGSEQLLTIATSMPQDLPLLLAIPGLPAKIVERNSSWLLAGVHAGLQLSESALPQFPVKARVQRSAWQERCLKSLKEWRTATAAALGLEPGVLIANAQLETCCDTLRGAKSLASAEGVLKDWQSELFGADLLTVVKKT